MATKGASPENSAREPAAERRLSRTAAGSRSRMEQWRIMGFVAQSGEPIRRGPARRILSAILARLIRGENSPTAINTPHPASGTTHAHAGSPATQGGK